jgi:hypothetical protein
MADSPSILRATRPWLIGCVAALGAMVLLSVLAHAFAPADLEAAGRVVLPVYFALFLVLGFSAVPLMTNLFVAALERMWTGAGLIGRPANARAMALLRRHQAHFILVAWGFYVAGLAIAAPHIVQAWNEAAPAAATR